MNIKSQKSYGISLLITSIIAWLASGTLVLEKLTLLQNPLHVPSCDLGLFLSCSTIMKTEQAALFGFPNPFLGIVGFAITGAIAVFLLMTSKQNITLPRWFYISLLAGITIAFGLVCFFWWTSVMVVMALCPWCMVVWSMVIPVFFNTLGFTLTNGAFGEYPKHMGQKILDWWWVASILTYLLIIASILVQFQEYIF